jgi:predicted nuclease with RNAse H fold
MTKFEKILKRYLELKGVKVISLEHHPYSKKVILKAPNYSFHTVFNDVEKYFQIGLIVIINIE